MDSDASLIEEEGKKMTIKEFVPREHGAWAMWIVPMLSAAVVSHFSLSFFALLICFALLYIIHHPVVLMIKKKVHADTKEVMKIAAVAVPGLLLALAIVALTGRVWLLLFGVGEFAFFATSVKSYLDREQRSFLNELSIVAALTLTGPAAYYVITGTLGLDAALLYLYNFLFFGGSVFYVKMKIEFLRNKGVWKDEAKRGRAMTVGYHLSVVAIVLSVAVLGLASAWVLLGFVPMLVQIAAGVVSKKPKMNFARLGVALVAQSAAFLIVVGLFMK